MKVREGTTDMKGLETMVDVSDIHRVKLEPSSKGETLFSKRELN